MSSNTAACQKLGILCIWSWSSQDVSRIPGLPEVPPAGIHSPGVFVIPRPAIQGSHWPEGAACSKPNCREQGQPPDKEARMGWGGGGTEVAESLSASSAPQHSTASRPTVWAAGWLFDKNFPHSSCLQLFSWQCLPSRTKHSKSFQCPNKSTCPREFKWFQLTLWHFYKVILLTYLFMTVLGLHCCTWAFSSWSEQGLLFIAVASLGAQTLGTQALVVAAPKPWSTGSIVSMHRLSCSVARGIFLDQGSNPCPLPWQADCSPLSHHGSPLWPFIMIVVWRLRGENPAMLSTFSQTAQQGILFWPNNLCASPLPLSVCL